MRWQPSLAVLLSSVALAVAAAAPTPDSPPTTARPTDWNAVIDRLGSDRYAEREAAQQELEKADYHLLDFLEHAAATRDEEIKARLERRILVIREDLLLHPPPISLELNNATADETLAALRQATNAWVPFRQPASSSLEPQAPDARFTLSAKDMPFWEVIARLTRQHPLEVPDNFYETPSLLRPPFIVVGPCVIYDVRVETRSDIWYYDGNDRREKTEYNVLCSVAVDPRVRIVNYVPPRARQVRDENGASLLKFNPNADEKPTYPVPLRMWSGPQIQPPAKPGRKIASLNGEIKFTAELRARQIDIPSVSAQLHTPFQLDGRSITFDALEQYAGKTRIAVQVRDERPTAKTDPWATPWIRVNLHDAAGNQLLETQIFTSSLLVMDSAPKEIIRAALSVPADTKLFLLPFELKDIPLPWNPDAPPPPPAK